MLANDGARDFFGLTPRWVETGGGERIYYHDEGSGFPLLFVHGSAVGVSAAANWWLNYPALTAGYRCIAPDLIGYGRSVPATSAGEWGLRYWVDQIVRFADALRLEQFMLVGNSLGGRISLHVALENPTRVAGLITMGTVGLAPPTPPPPRPLEKLWTRDDVAGSMRRMVFDPDIVTDGLVDARHEAISVPGAAEAFFRASLARNSSVSAIALARESLAAMQTPTLLVHGREDRVIPAASSFELAGIIPNADFHLFAHCGHWAQIERLEDFNALALHFARKLGI